MSVTNMTRCSVNFTTLLLAALSSTSPYPSAPFAGSPIPRRQIRSQGVSFDAQPQKLPRRTTGDDDNNEAASADASSGRRPSELEVEKKFPVSADPTAFDDLRGTLTSLGFRITHEEEFVDWYFDLPAPHWHFTLNDVWIRYREKKWKMDKNNWGWRGVWQVKSGRSSEGPGGGGTARREGDGVTVYREYQGVAAKGIILDLLSTLDSHGDGHQESAETLSSLKFDDVPHLDGAERLVAFSKFKTFRSCWQIPADLDGFNDFRGLKVDIDKTDIGFAVGEVEAIFQSGGNDDAAVESGKQKIRTLVELLTTSQTENIYGEEKDAFRKARSMGKLEYYLINNHRDHYDACVRAGVI